jgi:GT2 family glycosyltransferase
MPSRRPDVNAPKHGELPGVSLVILNWNGREHLGPVLSSTQKLDYPADRLEVIVADNASSDGSSAYVRDNFPAVRLIELDRNYGFAEGNNRAAAAAGHEWLAFLNNDMRVEPDWVSKLVAPVLTNPKLGAVSSKILNWDGTAIDFIGAGINFQGFGFQIDHGKRASEKDVARRLLCPCGGAMLVRKDLFLEFGGFDKDYFGFYEDTDLGWRLNLLGHDVWYTPEAVCYHRGHGSFDKIKAERTRLLYERNSLFTMYKCLDDTNLAAALPATMLLLNEKALRMADLDTAPYRLGPSTATEAETTKRKPSGAADRSYAFDPVGEDEEGIADKTRRVLREQGFGTFLRKGSRFVTTRVSARLRRAVDTVTGRRTSLPAISIAHYVALSDFAHQLPVLKEKRQWLQERRVRSDAELLPLFLFALEPSYHDHEYIKVHRRLLRVLGLDERFAAGDATRETAPSQD